MPWRGDIRVATADDLPFMREMLFEAFFWRTDQPRPPFEAFMRQPEVAKLLDGWGRTGDAGVMALDTNGASVGAAWYRVWTEDDHSYGFIDADTPELGIGVSTDARGRGVGMALIRALIATAHDAGLRHLSLSVEPENFARALYEQLGFRKVGEEGTAWTMLLAVAGTA